MNHEPTRPEKELLLCCSRTSLDTDGRKRLAALLEKELDWDYTIKTARQHKVMPLLYWNLNQTCPEAVPPATLSRLRAMFETNASANLALTSELFNLLKLFEERGIPVIPYKGPVLAASVYGNLTLRQFGDLDILVRPRDVIGAEDALIAQGYRSTADLGWEHEFRSPDGRVAVDLHQILTSWDFWVAFDMKGLWQRLQPIPMFGQNILSFSPEDLLLILCIYIARDCWDGQIRLLEIADLAELLRTHPEIDWERTVKEAEKTGTRRILLLGLFLVRELLGAKLPEIILQRITAEQFIIPLATQVGEWLFPETENFSKSRDKKLFYFQVRERPLDIIPYFSYRFYMKIAPNKADRRFITLPNYLDFLYYLVRPIRLLNKQRLRLKKWQGRRNRATKLGIEFHRCENFHLPDKININGEPKLLNLPDERGMKSVFIDNLLDDCYGLEKLSHPISTILDIGANVGLFSVAARNVFPHAIIHAYEPNPSLEKHLNNQAQVANFKYFMEAVGAADGKVLLNFNENSGCVRSQVDERGNVTMVALRQTIERLGGCVDLVKLDCEGAEWLIFEDREAWRSVKNLTMEYHLYPSHTEDEIRDIIENSLGFKIISHFSREGWCGLIQASRTY
ncbi:MAG: FkbM family methyltransferase [Microcystis sp. LE19-338.1B]|jgi:FkbM family methyltransferase|nr:FkbM family methyltransferase [Microcystis sp. LE19-338.1B]MCZ8360058.1 FkbM family methyltransferase [Microcystis sp. LE19-388.1G]